VTIIAALLLLNGLLALLTGLAEVIDLYRDLGGQITPDALQDRSADFTLLDWLTLPVTIAGIVMAWGMWTLHPKAWVATMFLQGLYLAAQLYVYFTGQPRYIQMLISVGTVFYLNQRDVQLVFRAPEKIAPHTLHPRDQDEVAYE